MTSPDFMDGSGFVERIDSHKRQRAQELGFDPSITSVGINRNRAANLFLMYCGQGYSDEAAIAFTREDVQREQEDGHTFPPTSW